VAATRTVESDEDGAGSASGSHLAPAQAGDSGGGGFWNWLGSWFGGSTESPQPAPPEVQLSLEDFSATLDSMRTTGQTVTPGTMPGRSGETMGQKMSNLYQTLAIAFPIYAGGIILDQAVGILIGNAAEFVAFQIAAKARGFLVTALKKKGKLVLNVVSAEGKNVKAAQFNSFVNQWNQEYKASLRRQSEAVLGAPNNFRWGNPKSKPTYGHTFLEHGKGVKPAQLADRARSKGTQIGQYLDDQAAADLVGDVAQRMGPGVHDVPLPEGLPTRVILPDGTEATADMVRVIVKPDGSVRSSYPFSSVHPTTL
jgi:hypothetical protein